MKSIDINSDLGESFGPWKMGNDAEMLSIVSSANIACGGHASDPETMFRTLQLAKENGVVVGAHPGFQDREGFGRRVIPMSPSEIARMCAAQIGALVSIASLVGTKVSYVKPHGALGNLAARDYEVAFALADAVKHIDKNLSYLAISGTQSERAARDAGVPVYSEIFADRGYLPNGELVPRGEAGAMIEDAKEAADRLVLFIRNGMMPVVNGDPISLEAHSVCVHGDSPHAVAMAKEVRRRFEAEGLGIGSFLNS
ncbi:MAG: 5-oxoprolinase subunit PxpA [Pseudomonadota bacterium]